MILGSHLPFAAPDYFLGTAKAANAYGENAFMIYSGAPQNSVRLPLDEENIKEGREYLSSFGFPLENIVAHSAYIINLAKANDDEKLHFSREFALEEIRRAKTLGASKIVFHPGYAKGVDPEEAFAVLKKSVGFLLENAPEGICICIENMVGRKNEICSSFDKIYEILKAYDFPSNLGMCLDTCHAHGAGYDLSDLPSFLKILDEQVGIKHIKVIHLNDSMAPLGFHIDRHENIGCGCIGFEALSNLASAKEFEDVPKILETPKFDGKCTHAKEIKMLRDGKYEEHWREGL